MPDFLAARETKSRPGRALGTDRPPPIPRGYAARVSSPPVALVPFSPAARAWFAGAFAEATPVQRDGWARIAAGEHALLLAPTGSGKTLAAFFYASIS